MRTSQIRGSVHVPLDALVNRLHEVPRGTVWVHCASGYRAGIAASILYLAGHPAIHVDDDFPNAAVSGLTLS